MNQSETTKLKKLIKKGEGAGVFYQYLAIYGMNHKDLPWGKETPLKAEFLVAFTKGEMLYGDG